ncbi:16S rRNA (guanine(527)-N(7))-methyltransferase RsmG [Hoeflea prorocentri]|uniref:Ribosomal RNA small subunit methyltransferase G n=1 Tax=Hoeflea prorocentri TaxID=1922333 RepID=A0A9X3ZJN5_9HYPH|nr:16S rRNA (guanine(527)-N(7))-methyltransferase RsmG [Hoeflea prorocentri]MCY6383176.1 16S rRNA (guanine(527)-N(7))-methyltransferase RsmG [Hoeflea prorocentri]MDA5400976.1 16S rRNA (guanine(527)-N(7))-methyltransferase RsmG [Hoeflea prorocentri]
MQSLHPVSRETLRRLEVFVGLFEKWSRSINLAAPSTLPHIWERHILDSAQIFALNPGPKAWLDIGSGGGFPGIVTAVLLCEQGAGHVDLVESNQKKAAFLRRALAETGGRGAVHAIRIEQAQKTLSGFDAVSARAVADLDMVLGYCSSWLEEGATAYFHKGRDYRREIDKARRSWSFDLVEHTSIVDADSVILQISKPVRT